MEISVTISGKVELVKRNLRKVENWRLAAELIST